MLKKEKGSTFGAILIVAGTAIGGGMLALPVLTSQAGFFPSLLLYLVSWLFMASTGTLLMEVTLSMKEESNIMTMAETTLGKMGKRIAFLLYLFLFYSLNIAYIAGGGGLISDVIETVFKGPLPRGFPALLFVLFFAPFVVIGTKSVDRLNRILMIGLFGSFFTFVILGFLAIDPSRLLRYDMKGSLTALPLLFTAFGFQGVVPTLACYLGQNGRKLRKAIWIGTLIPLLIYILWEGLILGVIPLPGLESAMRCGETAVSPLKRYLSMPWLYGLGQSFAFFAIVTSFLGVTLGLLDFLRDAFRIQKDSHGKALLAFLVFVPPLFFVMINPCLFLAALTYGGGFGCALLLGLLPIAMAYRARQSSELMVKKFLPGGTATLGILVLYLVIVMIATAYTLV